MTRRIPTSIGQRFSRLVVISGPRENEFPSGQKSFKVWCRCDCGREKEITEASLRGGTSRSCGCLQREWATQNAGTPKPHPLYGTPTYKVWNGMIARCYRPKASLATYARYGGIGIAVCQRWRDSFDAFLADMGERPPGLTIDRIDNDGDYEPGNCRWATAKQQADNRGNNQRVTLDGISMVAADAARLLRISGTTLYAWAKRNGKTQQEAADHFAAERLPC